MVSKGLTRIGGGWMKRGLILCLLFITTSCGRKLPARVSTPVPPTIPEYEIAYRTGLAAFREATPDGYLRATVAFRKAADLEPKNCEFAMHLGQTLLFLAQQQKLNWEEFESSVSEANAVLAFNQGAPGCVPYEAFLNRLSALSLAFRAGRANDALSMINRAIELDPDDPMNWIVLSQLRPTAARNSVLPIVRASQLAPDLPLVKYELGNYYLTNPETYGKAREEFEGVLKQSPGHFQSIIGIVYSLSLSGEEDVEPLLKKAVDIAPRSLKARTLLGDYYAGLEETELAMEQYQAGTSANPRYYPAHIAAGTALMTAGKTEQAEPSFNTVVQLDVKRPQPPLFGVDFNADATAHYYLGNVWFERGNLERAKAEYLESIADISNFTLPIYGLATVLHREGKIDDALIQIEKVLQFDPRNFPSAYSLRGAIRVERRQFADALKDFDKAIEIYKQQIIASEAKANVAESKGWNRKAEGERRRKATLEFALQKTVESRKAVEETESDQFLILP
jgi:tetratricopeptide (TPR) repeat protein